MPQQLLVCGDSREELRHLPDNTMHGGVLDPPYEINQAGAEWDRTGVAFSVPFWAESLRVHRPGAHLAVFGHSRKAHRLAVAMEDAGWEIRTTLMWVYSTGMPMSKDASKCVDEALGRTADRPIIGHQKYGQRVVPLTSAATEEAAEWEGFGTGLSPSYEPIILARKPLDGTIGQNLLKWGTGALHIDACRSADGKWPKDILLSEDALGLLPEQHRPLFHCMKVSMQEREFGCEDLPLHTPQEITGRAEGSAGAANPRAGTGRSSARRNHHNTVKPVQLLRWLTRLTMPRGGLMSDWFMGSGSAGLASVWEGMDYVGFERSPEYYAIAEARIRAAASRPTPVWATR